MDELKFFLTRESGFAILSTDDSILTTVDIIRTPHRRTAMIVMSVNDVQDTKIETFPYKGKNLEVKGTYIRWLSKAGPNEAPEYGLRYFTMGPGGSIPIHQHFYYQTMYVLEGRMRVTSYDPKTDEKIEEKEMGPNDVVFIPSMDPHSVANLSDVEKVTFLCCIANVYDEDAL
jgi:quercetin dioxygenase-like cupin family protein